MAETTDAENVRADGAKTEEYKPPEVTFPIVIKLKKPLKNGLSALTELRIEREPVIKDMYDVNFTRITPRDIMNVLSRIAQIPRPVLDEMSCYDYVNAQRVVNGFLDDIPTTGDEL
jgi:hypothetical protein